MDEFNLYSVSLTSVRTRMSGFFELKRDLRVWNFFEIEEAMLSVRTEFIGNEEELVRKGFGWGGVRDIERGLKEQLGLGLEMGMSA